ncbi:MAG: LapA family protein [Bacteroidales bacterium]|nr:LapA family protein [Bacteroidales bacterium]
MGYFKENTTKKIINIILIIILIVFVMLNLETTKVSLIFVTVDMPLVILISFVFLIGYFVGKTFIPTKCNDNKKIEEKKIQEDIE